MENQYAFAENHPHLLAAATWPVPAVYRRGDRLHAPWTMETKLASPPKGGLLPVFLRLHTGPDSQIEAFAKAYGLLLLCEPHRLPAGHSADCERPRVELIERKSGPVDDISDWRLWSRRFHGT